MPTDKPLIKSAPRGFGGWQQNLSNAILKLIGWRYEVRLPDVKKYIVIAAPHTSNADWFMMLLFTRAVNFRLHWAAKDSLFRWPISGLMKTLGGIPINRRERTNLTQLVIEAINRSDEIALAFAPEGTRKKTPYWKSGFYHIALGSGIPIVMASIDYPSKTICVNEWFYPSGDPKADMDIVRRFYAGKRGRNAHQYAEPRLKAELENKDAPEA